MDSDSDEEVFFGPVTVREETISVKLKNRRTENFTTAVPLFRRRSSRPSLASLEEEDKVQDNDSTISLVVHKDSTCNDQSLGTGSQPSLCEGSADDMSSQSSGLCEYTDESSVSAPDSHKSDAKPLFVFVSHSSVQVSNQKNDTEVEITQSNSIESHSNFPQEISSVSGVEASCESSGDSALHSNSYQNSEDESFTKNNEGLETTEEGIPEPDAIGGDKDTQVEAGVKEKNDSDSDAVLKKLEIEEQGHLDETKTELDDSISIDQITTKDQTSAASDESSCIADNLITGDHIEKSVTHKENKNHQNHNESYQVSAAQEETEEVIEDNECHENSSSQEKVCHVESSQSSEQIAVQNSVVSEIETIEQDDNDVKGTTLNEECEENYFDFQKHPSSLSNQSVKDCSFKAPHMPRLIKPRESYYSSLEVINVNEPLIYSGFVTEDSMDSTGELEQVIHGMDKMISQQGGEQQTIAVDKKYSSSLCESFSEGSDSVFGSVAHNVDSVSDKCMYSEPEQRKLSDFNDLYHRISEGDDSVFNDVDDSDHKPKLDNTDDSSDKNDHISPVTPPPKGPIMKTSSDFNQIFTVTPPPSSIPTLRKVLPSLESQSSPVTVTCLSSSSQNLGDSCADSYGSVNKAMILSQSEDHEPVTSALQPGACQSPADSPADFHYYSTHSDTDVQTYQSPKSQCRSGWTTYHTAKEGLDSPYDDSSDDESPQHKFNDTIEEMEMMLKYGLNYGEKALCADNKDEGKVDACEQGNMNNTGVVEGDHGEFESIISPRKSSVASTLSNFQPNLDSTHSSSLREDVLKCKVPVPCTDILEGNAVYSPTVTPNKKQKEAPPKPPRNLHYHNINPLQSQVVGQSKLQNNNSPVSKLGTTSRHKHSPLSTTPKVIKASTPRSGVMKQTVSRIRNEAPLVRSSSLTNLSRTPKAGQSPANTPVRSTTGFRSQPSTPVTRTVAPAKKGSPSVAPRINSARSGLPPRAPVGRTSQRQNTTNIVSTPKGQNIRPKMQVSSASKILSPSVRAAHNLKFQPGLSIVSPVAKYLKENPPPPLVVNVKPRHKISPVKIQAEAKASQRSPLPGSNTEATQREAALSRIQGDLEKLTSKMNSAKIAPNQASEPVVSKGRVLPRAVYTSAPVVVDSAEDKENERIRKRREIPTDKHPVLVMKHRGRVKLPKVTFKEGLIDSSPKGYKSPSSQSPLVSSLKNRESLRNSLMEVSIYESHETKYTSTLQK